jgi:hypothetical protein
MAAAATAGAENHDAIGSSCRDILIGRDCGMACQRCIIDDKQSGSSLNGGRGGGLNALSAIEIAPARRKIYFEKMRRKIRHTMRIKSLISHDITAPQWRRSHPSPYFACEIKIHQKMSPQDSQKGGEGSFAGGLRGQRTLPNGASWS